MDKRQYRAFVRAQKLMQRPPKKLIHLLINYRSKRAERYPFEFIHMMRQVKIGSKLWDYDALIYFIYREGAIFNTPSFNYSTHRSSKMNTPRETESDLPF